MHSFVNICVIRGKKISESAATLILYLIPPILYLPLHSQVYHLQLFISGAVKNV